MPFEFIETELKDVMIVKPRVFGDKRGFFLESYKKNDFFNAGIKEEFNQDIKPSGSIPRYKDLNQDLYCYL